METALGLKESIKSNESLAAGDLTYENGKVDTKFDGQVNGEVCGTPAGEHTSAHQGQADLTSRPFNAEPIAIVGMACRFPGDAVNVKGLWDMCCEGRSAWSEFAESRMNSRNFFHPHFSKRGTFNTRGAHYLKHDIGLFDAPFFNISSQEAKSMDPQQRLVLECAYEALENGGILLHDLVGENVGVYIAASTVDHFINNVKDSETIPTYLATGSESTMLSNRLSYTFDLKGPSMTVYTACSSSLTALHLACQSLRSGETQQAIVGGVQLIMSPDPMMIMSSMGRGSGYGRGEGVGVVILKPLSEAIDNGDPIRAIIRNTGVAQDGKTNGISVPSGDAQERLIRATYAGVGLDPSETAYVEAHGTGTTVGDPIEASAIAHTIAMQRQPNDPVIVGSIKTNIGHTEAASGLAGLIKAALIVESGLIPPNFDFRIPNPSIPLEQWNLKVPTEKLRWPLSVVRRASVCGFGLGGTNAHVILEGWPPQQLIPNGADLVNSSPAANDNQAFADEQSATSGRRVFVLSAADKEAVKVQAEQLAAYLKSKVRASEPSFWRDLAFTLTNRRSVFPWRIAFTALAVEELIDELEKPGLDATRIVKGTRLGFVFTGQGSQWANMGRELMGYRVFAESMQEAERCLKGLGAGWSLLDELAQDAKTTKIDQPSISQPSTTAVQISLVRLLASLNVYPTAVTGHSSGEIAAASATGALQLPACMAIAYYRGALSGSIARDGGMLAVGASALETQSLIGQIKEGRVAIACFNSPALTTVSGDAKAISELQTLTDERSIFARRLKVDVAYHSHHMQDIAAKYLSALETIDLHPADSAKISFYSSLIGKRTSTATLDAQYWCRNMTSPVMFHQSCQALILDGQKESAGRNVDAIVEIGPHSSLKSPIRDIFQTTEFATGVEYLPSLVRHTDAVLAIQQLLCRLFTLGFAPDLSGVNSCNTRSGAEGNVLTDLPTYPWTHRSSLWEESRVSKNHRFRKFPRHDLLGLLADDFNDMDMRWAGVLRLSDVPWLSEHKVQDSTVFPGMGYLAMAVEAAYQHATVNGVEVTNTFRYTLREVAIKRPLILDSIVDTETCFTLKAQSLGSRISSDTWNEFSIYSWTEGNGWCEHCRGLISCIDDNKPPNAIDGEVSMQSHRKNDRALRISQRDKCRVRFDGAGAYRTLSKTGFQYGTAFQNLVVGYAGDGSCVASIQVPDTASSMPRQFESGSVVHTAFLDSCAHTVLLALNGGCSAPALRLPSFVKSISISHGMSREPGHSFEACASTSNQSGRDTEASLMVFDNREADGQPLVNIKGLKFSTLSMKDVSSNGPGRGLCYKMQWEAYGDLLSQSQFREILPSKEERSSQVERLERAAFYYIDMALKQLSDREIEAALPHHKKQIRVFKKLVDLGEQGKLVCQTPEWLAYDDTQRHDHLESVRAADYCGKMTCEMGEHILPILRQEIEPLSVMLRDHLLERLYQDWPLHLETAGCAEWAQKVLSHQIPHMKIIEIGAGTGGTTIPVLKALSNPKFGVARFSKYTFTDISAGFFERARKHLSHLGDLVEYKTLNIENDPTSQGFVAGAYDLVIASSVLHATTRLNDTMQNVRKLLKAGGKLLIVEVTVPLCLTTLIFGTLPGWWAATEPGRQDAPILTEEQWDNLLQNTGFSGVDGPGACAREGNNIGSIMISTATSPSQEPLPLPAILVDTHHKSCSTIEITRDALSSVIGQRPLIMAFGDTRPDETPYSIIMTLDQPTWRPQMEEKFRYLQSVLSGSKGILWVTKGASDANPDANMILGLSRVIRGENHGLRLITLDLDQQTPLSDTQTAEVVCRLFKYAFDPARLKDSQESEFRERKGIIQIPRVLVDVEKDDFVMQEIFGPVPYPQPFVQEQRPLRMAFGTPGLPDSIYFRDHTQVMGAIADDEVEIKVKATGMNFKDVMIALGQLPYEDLGFECSGTVTRVGSKVEGFTMGDTVCGMTRCAFASIVRTTQSLVSTIPRDMNIDVAASFPLVFCTALHSLTDIAKLQRGESILIHCAAGGVGQASVMLAQHLGAEVFVSVSSPEKRDLVMSLYGVPKDHIFSSRDTTFEAGIRRLTNGAGVDVVLNCLSGEALHASWRCLADFGRFVEIGKRDLVQNNRLEMNGFIKSIAFSAVDLVLLMEKKPWIIGKLMADIVEMFNRNNIKLVSPLNFYSMSEVQDAIRLMQAGKHMGKVVIRTKGDDMVRAIAPPLRKFVSPDYSYLIIGGMGGVGRSITRWLLKQGAKSVILASRSGKMSPAVQALVEEATMLGNGAQISVYKCDVRDREQVQQLQDAYSKRKPIRGVIHGAMAVRDTLFEKSTLADWVEVTGPRVQGAWNLHHCMGSDLDFFILLSSISSFYGNHGQAAYAASNTFLDAFAAYRRAHGLPAATIDIGIVDDIGYIAEAEPAKQAQFHAQGHDRVQEQELLSLIKAAIVHEHENCDYTQTITGLKLVPGAKLPWWTSEPKASHILHAVRSTAAAEPSSTAPTVRLDRLLGEAASMAEATRIVCAALVHKVSQVSTTPLESIEPDQPLLVYGLDSLVAVELRNWMVSELGATVPLLELTNSPSIEALAQLAAAQSRFVDLTALKQKEET